MTISMFGLGLGMMINSMPLCIVAIIIFVLAFEWSWGPVVWMYNAEILNDKAFSLAVTFYWLMNMTVTVVAPTIQQALDPSKAGLLFFGFGIFQFFATILATYKMKETRGLTPLEI